MSDDYFPVNREEKEFWEQNEESKKCQTKLFGAQEW